MSYILEVNIILYVNCFWKIIYTLKKLAIKVFFAIREWTEEKIIDYIRNYPILVCAVNFLEYNFFLIFVLVLIYSYTSKLLATNIGMNDLATNFFFLVFSYFSTIFIYSKKDYLIQLVLWFIRFKIVLNECCFILMWYVNLASKPFNTMLS